MPQDVQRGYCPTDEKEFNEAQLRLLQEVQQDLSYLLDRGYDMERSVTFIANRYMLSARQRTALTRASASRQALAARAGKKITGKLTGKTVYVDGFNLIITLEAALAPETTLLRCLDGTVRDLCGLRGTYRVIESTAQALGMTVAALKQREAARAVFYLDAPVSNSGRLRAEILQAMAQGGLPADVILVPNADRELWEQENVVSSDGVILDRCHSWLNLAAEIIDQELPGRRVVDLSQCR